MELIPFVAGSYDLDTRQSGVQRTINMVPVPEEPGNERTAWVFKDAAGLEEWSEDPGIVPNPYYLNTILQTSVTTDELIDVSPLANALSKAGSGGGPAYTAADPLFGGPVYDLSDTTHRLILTDGDGFIATNFDADEWTAELQIKGVGPGASGNFMALSAISFGLWVSGFDIAFNVSNIGGGSFTVGGATLNPAQFDHVVLQRNNTADPDYGFLELGLNGVRVGVSTTFLKTHPIATGAGFAMLLGYFTIGARLKSNEIRFVKNQRVYNMSTDYATPLAYTPQSAPHPVGP